MAARHPYRRGEVVLVQFPFSGATGQKDRPAVVLSTDDYHDGWDELLLAAVTSRAPKSARRTDCPIRDWKAAGLQHPSWVRSHLAAIHRLLVLRKLGDLTPADLQAVEQCLRLALGLWRVRDVALPWAAWRGLRRQDLVVGELPSPLPDRKKARPGKAWQALRSSRGAVWLWLTFGATSPGHP